MKFSSRKMSSLGFWTQHRNIERSRKISKDYWQSEDMKSHSLQGKKRLNLCVNLNYTIIPPAPPHPHHLMVLDAQWRNKFSFWAVVIRGKLYPLSKLFSSIVSLPCGAMLWVTCDITCRQKWKLFCVTPCDKLSLSHLRKLWVYYKVAWGRVKGTR